MIVSYHRINVTFSDIVAKWKRKREQNKHLTDQPRSDWPSKLVGVVGKESWHHKIQRLYIGGKSTKKCSKELNISDASSLAPKSWYCYRLVKYTQCSIRQTVNANIMWIKSFKNNLNLPWINKKKHWQGWWTKDGSISRTRYACSRWCAPHTFIVTQNCRKDKLTSFISSKEEWPGNSPDLNCIENC